MTFSNFASSCPNTERLLHRIITLPTHEGLREADIKKIIETVKKGTRLLFPFRREGQATNSETLKTLGNLNPSKSGMSGKVYYSEGLAPSLVRGKGEGFKVAIPCMKPDRLGKRQNGRRFKENQEPMFTLNTQYRHGRVGKGIANTLTTSG